MKKKTFALGAALLSLSALTLGGIAGELSNTYAIDARAEGDEDNSQVTGIDMFYSAEGSVSYSGESTLLNNDTVGQIYYWSDEWTSATVTYEEEGDSNKLTCTYTNLYNWYGMQLFYLAPYYKVVDTSQWVVKANVTSTNSGTITINGTLVELEANAPKSIEIAAQSSGDSTLDVQFGYEDTSNSTSVFLSSNGTVVFENLEIIDSTNTYYVVTFLDQENNVIDQVYTLAGQVPWTSPEAEEISGSSFLGWTDENSNLVTDISTFIPTGDVTLKATYATSDATVNYYVGNTVVGTVSATQGYPITAPSYGYDEYGFGYGLEGWYTDADFTTAWDFTNDTVTGDLCLYAKTWVQPDATYLESTNGSISDEYLTHDELGNFVFSGMAAEGTQSWHVQVNFKNIPVLESGKAYNLTITYKANYAYYVQLYDAGAIDAAYLVANEEEWQTLELSYEGGTLCECNNNYLTFEFGGYNSGGTYYLSIQSIEIVEQSFDVVAFVPNNWDPYEGCAFIKNGDSSLGSVAMSIVKIDDTPVEIKFNGVEYYIYKGTVTPSDFGLTTDDASAYTVQFVDYDTYNLGTVTPNNYSNNSWNDFIFAAAGTVNGDAAMVDGGVDDLNAAIDYLSGTLYGSNWRQSGSICWLTENTSELNNLLTDYDALDEDVRYWADMFVDYGDENKCTYGETIAYLATFNVDTSNETLSIFGDSDSATMIAMIVLISAAAILGLGGVLIYKRRHNAA